MDFFKTFFDYQTFIDTLLRTVWDVLPICLLYTSDAADEMSEV